MAFKEKVRNKLLWSKAVAKTTAQRWGAVLKFHRKKIGIGAGVLAVILIAGWFIIPAPQAEGSLKGHTVEIYRNAEFRVIFDQPMNKQSVQDALMVKPAVNGGFSWQNNMMIFKPEQDLVKGADYELTIDQTAKNLIFKPLNEVYRQTFHVLDYPEVVVTAPVDASVIMPDQRLTVLFDHPIRALTKEVKAPELMQIYPPVKGDYLWLGTSGFEFVPLNGWPASTAFTVTVPKGTKMADGGQTIQDFTWKFQTENLAVSIPIEERHKPKDPIRLTFNYPVQPSVVAKALIIKTNIDENQVETLPASQFRFTTDPKDLRTILIDKIGGFELGKIYNLSLPINFTADLGPLGLTVEFTAAIIMPEKNFVLLSSDPSTDGSKCVNCGLVLKFNNPADIEAAKNNVRIVPPIEGLDMYASDYDGYRLDISGDWKASTNYTLILGSGLSDIYGQKISQSISIKFKTDPYEPSVNLASYSDFGVLAAHLPRIYQLRTLNVTNPITAKLCSGTYEQYADKSDFDCKISAEKTYDAAGTLNDFKIIDLDLDKLAGQNLPLGAYRLDLDLPKTDYYDNNQSRTLLIVNTSITLKYDQSGKVLVWATDLKSGEPVANLDVELRQGGYDAAMEKSNIPNKKTDQNGLAVFETGNLPSLTYLVKAQNNDHFGLASTEWEDGISPWNYNLNNTYMQGPKSVGYVYTDRRIYRPDQQVEFKGIVRNDVDAKLSLPKSQEVSVTISDANSTEVYNQKLPLTTYGSFNSSLQLNPAMPLGTYTIMATVNSGEQAIQGTFSVMEYRRPDFKVGADLSQSQFIAGQKIEIPVHSEYYHGVPLGGAKVSYSISRSRYYFQPLSNEWYSYSSDDSGYDCWWYCGNTTEYESILTGETVLDEKGNATITLGANLTDYKFSASYSVDITVTDINQRTVSSNLSFPVHKGEYYLGIRPDYSAGWDAPNADFEIISLTTDGKVRPNVTASVSFSKRTWSNIQKTNPDSSTTWEYQKKDSLLETRSITTDGEGKAKIKFTPAESGEFIAEVKSTDSQGNIISATANRYIYRDGFGGVRISDDHHMKIIQSQASYEIGQTAKLAVQTPYENTKALVTVERDNIKEYKVITLGTKDRIVEIPITDADTPNIYVSVLAVQGGGEKDVPEFRLGYANLQVNTIHKILNLKVTPDKTTYKPGEKVTLSIDANLFDGQAADAEVSIAVVDERVTALLGSIDKNILGRFWFDRTIGVKTAQTLTRLVKKIFFATEGGGGKGAGDSSPAIRGNFKDTAYWNATVTTGSDGKAEVSFTLPDNLTSWEILAIGATKNTEVGSADAKIVTRRDLLVEPLLPRILRQSDRASIGATVINSTNQTISAQVSISLEKLSLNDNVTKNVTLPPLGRQAVYWLVSAPTDETESKVRVQVKGGEFEDGFEVTLPILPYSVPETVTASGILERNVTETIEIPDDILKNVGDLTVSVEPNVGNGLQKGLDYLVEYPYGCAEQKTSSLMANLIFSELVKLKVSAGDEQKTAQAKSNVEEAIKLIAQLQRYDGGFGFWSDSDTTYPHLTAYVMWGLTQASKAGFTVDQKVFDQADTYLRESLNNPKENNYYWDNEKAQVLFMLSERRAGGLAGYASTLYERRDKLSSFGKAFLAMAYANIESPSSAKTEKIMGELKNRLVYLNPTTAYMQEDPGYDWFFSSDLRTTGIFLEAMLRTEPESVNIEQMVRYLIENREDGYWGTTQNTAIVLLALVDYVRANPINDNPNKVDLFLNNKIIESLSFPKGDVSGQASKVFDLPSLTKQGQTQQIGLEKDSDTKYFYDMTLKTYRQAEDIQPFDNGFTVVSDIYSLDDKKSQHPLDKVKLGERVRIRLKLLVPKNHKYVALEGHLPAGLEAIDFSLNTSPKELAGQVQQCAPDWWGESHCFSENSWQWSWWWGNVWKHIEFRDDRVFLFTENLDAGIYEYEFIAQAITPGEFRVPPARVYEFYNPKANAHNEGKIFTVTK